MKKNIFIVIGSASNNSANQKLIELLCKKATGQFNCKIFNGLKSLPHFDPELSRVDPPLPVKQFREDVEQADGVVICTPEYVFSVPSGLKNAIEWCVSSTVFSDKPIGIITASADGQAGHNELKMIMRTLGANITEETCLLIRGIRGKISQEGEITDSSTMKELNDFIEAFVSHVESYPRTLP